MKRILVSIIVGSDSDLPSLQGAARVLEEFGVPYRISIASAHRTPQRVKECVRSAEQEGARVFIAVAGMAAALPGVVAAETTCPVIGVPMEGKSLSGMDALFSIAQMPPGIPVAAVAIGKAGATNAALLAVEILAVSDDALRDTLAQYRGKMAAGIIAKDKKLNEIGLERYIAESGKP
jgi:5-(carboxyamino)imidazole ribonucleotide mutase